MFSMIAFERQDETAQRDSVDFCAVDPVVERTCKFHTPTRRTNNLTIKCESFFADVVAVSWCMPCRLGVARGRRRCARAGLRCDGREGDCRDFRALAALQRAGAGASRGACSQAPLARALDSHSLVAVAVERARRAPARRACVLAAARC